jgi:hypothetical protein
MYKLYTPRKIKVVDLEKAEQQPPPEEIVVEFDDFSRIKNEVNNIATYDDKNYNNDVEIIDNSNNEVKEKKVRKPRATKKNIIVEEVKPIEDEKPIVIEEVKPVVIEEVKSIEEEKPSKKIRTQELETCPKFSKQMTKKTLRYFHEKSCPGVVIDKDSLPVKKRTIKKDSNETVNNINIPEEVIENEVKKK